MTSPCITSHWVGIGEYGEAEPSLAFYILTQRFMSQEMTSAWQLPTTILSEVPLKPEAKQYLTSSALALSLWVWRSNTQATLSTLQDVGPLYFMPGQYNTQSWLQRQPSGPNVPDSSANRLAWLQCIRLEWSVTAHFGCFCWIDKGLLKIISTFQSLSWSGVDR